MRASIILLALLISSNALGWVDLWQTPDQKASKLLKEHKYKAAFATFKSNDWAAVAAYRSGEYEEAARLFAKQNNADGYYNQANALAHMGKYEQAIKALDEALKLAPNDADAKYNKKVLEDLLKKQQQEKQKNQSQTNQKKQQQDKDNEQDKNDSNTEKGSQDKNKPEENTNNKNDSKNKSDEDAKKDVKDRQNEDKKEDKEKQQPQKEEKQNQDERKDENVSEAKEESKNKNEQHQQWLRLIPDDPGGLLREKFLRDHLQRKHGW